MEEKDEMNFTELCKFPDKHYMNQFVWIGMDMNGAIGRKLGIASRSYLYFEIEEYGMQFFELGMRFYRAVEDEKYRRRKSE